MQVNIRYQKKLVQLDNLYIIILARKANPCDKYPKFWIFLELFCFVVTPQRIGTIQKTEYAGISIFSKLFEKKFFFWIFQLQVPPTAQSPGGIENLKIMDFELGDRFRVVRWSSYLVGMWYP